MIGVALVAFIMFFAASAKTSLAGSLAHDYHGTYIVDSGSFDGIAVQSGAGRKLGDTVTVTFATGAQDFTVRAVYHTARIDALKGTPLVINKWASWCGPCQAEFPVFQAAALKHGKEVGFIGLNSEDKDPKARRFLAERPLPFPSYTDPQSKVAYARQIAAGFPMTMFVDRNGKTYTHTGPYTSEEQLSKDIERYLG
jgi:thiol-disulfide isomerase/thioredoxin